MSHTNSRSRLSCAVAAALLTGAAGNAAASGFMIVEQSVHEVGRAVSGASAAADNLGTMFFNPAGITRFEGTQGAAALHIILPEADFEGGAVTNPLVGGGPVSGAEDETDEIGLVPNLYFVADINEDVKFGLGINAPFGLVTEYDDNWVGRYHAIKSDLKTVNINPTIGYQVNDQLSLGFGFSAMYSDVELTNAVDGVAFAFNPQIGICPSPAPICSLGFGSGLADGKVKLEGDDWGFGFNLGALYQINDATRVGFAYRSKIDQTLEGTATTTVLGLTISDLIEADLTLPDTASVGIHHQVNAKWAVMADVAWTNWSEFDRLEAKSRTTGAILLSQPENWDDSWRYSAGLEYKPDNAWTFRGGVALDETPIPSAELRTPRIPGEERTWLSFGLTYAPGDNMTFDLAYAHLFIDDSSINNTDETFGYTLTGEFENTTDIISAQMNYKF
jgi:long-chain fatty acid transport protein